MNWRISKISGHPGCPTKYIARCENAIGEIETAFSEGSGSWERLIQWIEKKTNESILECVRTTPANVIHEHEIDPYDNTVTAT